MEFLKEKVFTALNADEAKAGSKGYFADNLDTLKCLVNRNAVTGVLNEVYPEDWRARFGKKDCNFMFTLFYLVEEPAEEKYRPYKNTDELIEDWKERTLAYGSAYFSKNPMFCPSIWVKCSENSACKHLITDFTYNSIGINDLICGFEELFEGFTYLDGTPCGKKNLKEKKQ